VTIEFKLPDIGEGLHEAEVVQWFVAEGDTIGRNEPFVEILTDKANVEMPAPAAGVVSLLGAAVGDIVQVGDLLIVIDDGGEQDTPERADSTPPAVTSPTATSGSTIGDPPMNGGRRPKAAPATRRLAAELGVDLERLADSGTGPGGRILADDVQRAATALAARPSDRPDAALTARGPESGATIGQMAPGVHPLRGIRRATAKAMDRSWTTIPHISASNEIDATALLAAREQLRELQSAGAANITPLVVVLVAVARALRRYPIMNAGLDLDAETITVFERINIGLAVATDHGLIVPIIGDADRLGVQAMADEVERLSSAARNRSVSSDDLTGGTHTVTNYGSAGTHLAAPIIRPGEAAITGLGSIELRPTVVDGESGPEVVARPTLPLVVCGDHRLVDGDIMSAFQNHIAHTLRAPIGLLL